MKRQHMAMEREGKEKLTPPTVNPKKPRIVDREKRRLDSLARLLEGKSKCSAVCFVGDEILITDNNIYRSSKDNQTVTMLIETLKHLEKIKTLKSESEEETIKVLTTICNAKIDGLVEKAPDLHLGLDEETVKRIVRYVYSNSSNWTSILDEKIGFLLKFLPEEKIASHADLVAVQFALNKAFETVRDYKKVKKFLKDKEKVNFKILAIGSKEEHAEVRMISYLLETGKLRLIEEDSKDHGVEKKGNEESSPVYIGISKLCCKDCINFVNAINKVLPNKLQHTNEEGKIDSFRIIEEELLSTRGFHGQPPSAWGEPCYLNDLQPSAILKSTMPKNQSLVIGELYFFLERKKGKSKNNSSKDSEVKYKIKDSRGNVHEYTLVENELNKDTLIFIKSVLEKKDHDLLNQNSLLEESVDEKHKKVFETIFKEMLKQHRIQNYLSNEIKVWTTNEKEWGKSTVKLLENDILDRLYEWLRETYASEKGNEVEKQTNMYPEQSPSPATSPLMETDVPEGPLDDEDMRVLGFYDMANIPEAESSAMKEDNEWATGLGIQKVLEHYLEGAAHIIPPDTSAISSPIDPDSEKEGTIKYAQMIAGYYDQEGKFHDIGFSGKEGDELKKPVVMILNTGGGHWVTCVILPREYTMLEQTLVNDKVRVFFIDSLDRSEKSKLPEFFKGVLRDGIEFESERELSEKELKREDASSLKKTYRQRIPPICKNSEDVVFIDCINIPQQKGGSDCGWWATYNAIMLTVTGSDDFTQQFKERRRAPELRECFPLLTSGEKENISLNRSNVLNLFDKIKKLVGGEDKGEIKEKEREEVLQGINLILEGNRSRVYEFSENLKTLNDLYEKMKKIFSPQEKDSVDKEIQTGITSLTEIFGQFHRKSELSAKGAESKDIFPKKDLNPK